MLVHGLQMTGRHGCRLTNGEVCASVSRPPQPCGRSTTPRRIGCAQLNLRPLDLRRLTAQPREVSCTPQHGLQDRSSCAADGGCYHWSCTQDRRPHLRCVPSYPHALLQAGHAFSVHIPRLHRGDRVVDDQLENLRLRVGERRGAGASRPTVGTIIDTKVARQS